jgi:nucleotide-binding universal stress UspA family protein
VNNVPNKSCFQKILVAVDGSETSLQAEELTALLAKDFQSKITVAHAVPEQLLDLSVKTPYANIPHAVIKEISEWFVKKGEEILNNAQALFGEEGLTVDARILHGDSAENIISLASAEKYDLILLGNRGETEAEAFSLGSNAEKISRHAECSVLIVKEKSKISKILVAIDGSENAKKALQLTAQLGQKLNAEITAMHVIEGGLFGLAPKLAQNVGEKLLSEAVEEVKAVNLAKRLEPGSPSEKLIETAKKEGYDLIVVGSRGLSRVKRFFLGSVSDDVSHHAPCSVLIVR